MRQTPAEIDEGIVDTAAGLFAVHGFDRTSVQQIADAVGYSKTGLLHRFPSKQSLLDAVFALIDGALDKLMAAAARVPAGPDRMRRIIELVIDAALQYPGTVQYLLQSIVREQWDGCPAGVADTGERIVTLIAGDDASDELQLRVMLALELICSGTAHSATGQHPDIGSRLPALLAEIAAGVIGVTDRAAAAAH